MLTVKQAANELGVVPITIYRYVKTGRLAHCRVGGQIRIPKAEIERMLTPMLKADG